MGQIACIPMGDMNATERRQFHVAAWRAFEAKASKELAIPATGMTVRDAILGDSASTDWFDLKTKTPSTAGQEFWSEDSGDLSAGDLSPTLDLTYVLPTGTAIGIYGFFDLSTTKDLTMLQYIRGAQSLLVIETEKCYGDPNATDGGFFVDTNDSSGMLPVLLFWKQNENVQIKHNFKVAADRFVGHFALVAEAAGKRMNGVTPQVCQPNQSA